jgi:hypothetical protein
MKERREVNEEVGSRIYDEVLEVVVLLRHLLSDGLLARYPDGAAKHRARAEAQVAHAESSHLLVQRAVRSAWKLSTRREHRSNGSSQQRESQPEGRIADGRSAA